ncbi:MAG: glycoside hydrolase family 44 protein [Candidatus Promineifilaceae bacterium]
MNQFTKYLPVVSLVALVIAFVLLITSLLVAQSIRGSVEAAADPGQSITALNDGEDVSAEQVAAIETANVQVALFAQATETVRAIEAVAQTDEVALAQMVSAETPPPTSEAVVREAKRLEIVPSAEETDAAAEGIADESPAVMNTPYAIYKNTLTRGWENRTFDGNVNFNGFPAYDGLTSMTMGFAQADGAIYLYTPNEINVSTYRAIRFFINGGAAGGQKIAVALVDENDAVLQHVPLTPPSANNWQQVDINLEELGNPTAIRGVQFVDLLGDAQPLFFIDELALVDDPLQGALDTREANGPRLEINLNDERHLISDFIYGMNWADEATANLIDLPLNRWGGNATTRYNWKADASNAGSNWYFENTPPEVPNPNLPFDSSADKFVQQNARTGTETILTLPMTGWVARGDGSCGFSVEMYGEQAGADPWRPECGTGISADGTLITDIQPTNTSIPVGPAFNQAWMSHLKGRFGSAEEGGVRFYSLDNEPGLWNLTHRDIRVEGHIDTDELLDRTFAYASAAKEIDPAGQTIGPVLWGWSAYFWSAVDVYSGEDPNLIAPDRNAHGNIPFVAYYLQQMKKHEEDTGTRLLDYFDLHFYPQAVGVAFNEAGDDAVQALRLRSTRALWDPTYVDESWIETPVMLIPRMRTWRDENYPNTKLAVSEYNWGGLEHINGAVAQADVLGIFGDEALDMAALWSPPEVNSPGMFAFRMYRNYDGQHSKFGNLSIRATSTDREQLAVYAAKRTQDGVYTVLILNKSAAPLTSDVVLNGYNGAAITGFRYSELNLDAIEQIRLSDVNAATGALVETFPPHSLTLIVVDATN